MIYKSLITALTTLVVLSILVVGCGGPVKDKSPVGSDEKTH